MLTNSSSHCWTHHLLMPAPLPSPRLFTHSSLPGSQQDLRFLFALSLAVARARALTWQQLGRGRCAGTHGDVCKYAFPARTWRAVECPSLEVEFCTKKKGDRKDWNGDQKGGGKHLSGRATDWLTWLKTEGTAHSIPLCIKSLNISINVSFLLPKRRVDDWNDRSATPSTTILVCHKLTRREKGRKKTRKTLNVCRSNAVFLPLSHISMFAECTQCVCSASSRQGARAMCRKPSSPTYSDTPPASCFPIHPVSTSSLNGRLAPTVTFTEIEFWI